MRYIDSLHEGERVTSIYMCKQKNAATTKNGKPYENVLLQDRTGTLDAKIWEPYKAKSMPLDYKIDKDMLKLISEANVKYGEYKSLLNTLEFDASYFLDSVILNESYKSTQIEGTQISQDEMFYLKYMEKTDDNQEIQNLKKTIEYAQTYLQTKKQINYELVNEMHKIILDSVRGSQRTPGKIRTTQNWIGPRGCTIEGATFIPPDIT